MAVHSFDLGERVTIFQMSPRDGLYIEGRAFIAKIVDDVDEQYKVRFDDAMGDDDVYERFVDAQGQEDPDAYLREFNKKIGKVA